MNQSTRSNNTLNHTSFVNSAILQQYFQSEIFLLGIGSDWLSDLFYLLISIFSISGFLLNLLSYFVFTKLKQSFLIQNLKLYCLSSSIPCLIFSILFVYNSPRIMGYKIDFFANVYQCLIKSYNSTSMYFVVNCFMD